MCKNSKLRHWCFVPNNLSSIKAQVRIDVELTHLLTQAHRELEILSGMIKSIPDIGSLLNMVYLMEAQKSCAIDNIITGFEGMLNNSGQTMDETVIQLSHKKVQLRLK